MRKPTPQAELFRWHAGAVEHVERFGSLDGFDDVAHPDDPQCGYFKRRGTRGGAWFAAAIWMEQIVDGDGELLEPERLLCAVDGKLCDPVREWNYICAHPVRYEEYKYLVDLGSWARKYAPGTPEADMRRKIDVARMPAPF